MLREIFVFDESKLVTSKNYQQYCENPIPSQSHQIDQLVSFIKRLKNDKEAIKKSDSKNGV